MTSKFGGIAVDERVDPDYRGVPVQNPDGTFSTERTITIEMDGTYYNIPSLVDGKQLSEDEVVDGFLDGTIKAVGVGSSLEEATAEAEKRSSMLGGTGSKFGGIPIVEPAPTPPVISPPKEEEDQERIAFTDMFTGAIKNFPGDVKAQVMGFIDAVKDYKGTARAIGGLAKDIAKTQIEDTVRQFGFEPKEELMQTETLDAVIKDMKDSYGSIENLKRTIRDNPARAAIDIASIVAPFAKGIEAVGTISKIPGVAKAGELTAKAASLIDPVTAAGQVVSGAAKLIPKSLPSKIYQSAAKFSTTLTEVERNAITSTALNNQLMPTIKGLNKIEGRVNDFNRVITDMIDDAQKSGKRIPVSRLFKEFEVLKKEALFSGKPAQNRKALDKIKKDFMDEYSAVGKDFLTPEEAQRLKQQIYKDLDSWYSKTNDGPIAVEAQKSIARAAKEALEEIFPEIKSLNMKEGELLELREHLERSASRISNRDIVSIGAPLKGVAGGAVAGAPGFLSGITLGLLDTPLIKSWIALKAHRLKAKGIKINPNSAIVRLGLLNLTELEGETE